MEDRLRRYEKIEFLGEGQFATVYKAKDTETDTIVAVKKIKVGSRAEAKDGINRTALREIKLLQELHHPNIIGLLDVFGHVSNVSLVFDFMDIDLEVIIKDTTIVLTPANIKSYMMQTLQGLEYLHNNWILHRDLKPNNLLVNSEGVLKIGDFGLAKFFGSPNRIYTHQVVTRWYRAPELLFGARMYGTSVDMWAVGCILAELLLRVPFLPGETDLDQLTRIFQVMGTPTEETWPGLTSLQDYVQYKEMPGTPLKHIFSAAGDDLLDLISSLLTVNPLARCTCEQALQMPYFSNKPAPTPGPQLPLPATVNRKRNEERPSLKRKLLDAMEGAVVISTSPSSSSHNHNPAAHGSPHREAEASEPSASSPHGSGSGYIARGSGTARFSPSSKQRARGSQRPTPIVWNEPGSSMGSTSPRSEIPGGGRGMPPIIQMGRGMPDQRGFPPRERCTR